MALCSCINKLIELHRKEELWVLTKNILVSWNEYRLCNDGNSVTSVPPASHDYTLKADSHIACRAHAAPIPFSCHAVPLSV